jgi:hypothetical protein
MIDRLLAYEAGELTDEQTLDLFRDLVASGLVWQVAKHIWKHGANTPLRLDANKKPKPGKPGPILIRRDALALPKDPAARRRLSNLEKWCEDDSALTPQLMDTTGIA